MQVAKYKDLHCLNFLKSANINQLSRYVYIYTVYSHVYSKNVSIKDVFRSTFIKL